MNTRCCTLCCCACKKTGPTVTKLSNDLFAPCGRAPIDMVLRRRSTTGASPPAGAAQRASHPEQRAAKRKNERVAPQYIHSMLNPHSKRQQAIVYRWSMTVLTVVSLVSYLVESLPRVQRTPVLPDVFDAIDGGVSVIFLGDFCLRLLVAPDVRRYRALGPCYARLRWLISWDSVVLSVATFPFFIDLLDGHQTFANFSWLRVFRVFLLFRTSRFSQSWHMVSRVVFVNRSVLLVSLAFVFFMVLITASLLYSLSDRATRTANELDSIPDAAYLAILMLVGQAMPEPPEGASLSPALHVVIVITAFLSVPFFAVPAGLLVWSFEGEAARCAKHEERKLLQRKAYGGNQEDLSIVASSTESESTSELEEYIHGIGGGASEVDVDQAEEEAYHFFAASDALSGLQLASADTKEVRFELIPKRGPAPCMQALSMATHSSAQHGVPLPACKRSSRRLPSSPRRAGAHASARAPASRQEPRSRAAGQAAARRSPAAAALRCSGAHSEGRGAGRGRGSGCCCGRRR